MDTVDEIIAILEDRKRLIDLQIARYRATRPVAVKREVAKMTAVPVSVPAAALPVMELAFRGSPSDSLGEDDRLSRRRSVFEKLLSGPATVKTVARELGLNFTTTWNDLAWLRTRGLAAVSNKLWRATANGREWFEKAA